MNPPPVGTSVLLKIFAWPYFFQVHGKVFLSDPDFGVTVAFDPIESRYVTEFQSGVGPQCCRKFAEGTPPHYSANCAIQDRRVAQHVYRMR